MPKIFFQTRIFPENPDIKKAHLGREYYLCEPNVSKRWDKWLTFSYFREAIYRYKPTSTANGVANGKAHVASYEELLIKEKGETKPKGGNPSFFLAIMRALGPRYAIAGVYKFVYNNINFLNPMVLG